MKFLWNLQFKDFKETRHTKWTVKFWQESEKKKVLLRWENLYKNVSFFCVFSWKVTAGESPAEGRAQPRGAHWRFPAGMKDATAQEMAPEGALAVSCLPGVTPGKVLQTLPHLQLRSKNWIKCTQQDQNTASRAGWHLSNTKFSQDE